MNGLHRREFLTAAGAAALCRGASGSVTRIGCVRSDHRKLPRPAPVESALDAAQVRDMVWRAIEYAPPRAGSLDALIRPGSWVVVKPNIVFLSSQSDYTTGDVTDFRVIQAVIEYLARYTRARRITVAEGGSYRRRGDPGTNLIVEQNGIRVGALDYDWGDREFPGWGGTLGAMLARFRREFPDKTFDYVDLAYDAVRDRQGRFVRVPVRRTEEGVGAFAGPRGYFVTNTIRNCDYLIDVPVMKVHSECGITVCMKNYVGTAPREAYAPEWRFSNRKLHDECTIEERIDGFIADLASYHPPDYGVVDALRGLQYANHNNGRPGQMVQSNLVLAGEDPVAIDALAAKIMGFNPWDVDHLHMTARRGMGTMDLRRVEVNGDDPDRSAHRWGKPARWHGRANRDWLVTADPRAPMAAWRPHTPIADNLHFARALGPVPPSVMLAAAARLRAAGHRKAFLWLGLNGRATVRLNGEVVLREASDTRYRRGQFRAQVELRPGENLLVVEAEALAGPPRISALFTGTRDDGDTVDGIEWLASAGSS